jgi:hypothetical protein
MELNVAIVLFFLLGGFLVGIAMIKIISNKPKGGVMKCQHTDVAISTVMPITLQPKRGRCNRCGKPVKAKLIWEDR